MSEVLTPTATATATATGGPAATVAALKMAKKTAPSRPAPPRRTAPTPKSEEQKAAEAEAREAKRLEREELKAKLLEEGDQPEPAMAPMQILPPGTTPSFIQSRGAIRAVDMEKKYKIRNQFALPRTAAGIDIDKVNTDLHYQWLLEENFHESEWNNYAPVLSSNDGGANLPARCFRPDGTIMSGRHYLAWTLREFHLSKKAEPRDIMAQAINSFSGVHSTTPAGSHAAELGAVDQGESNMVPAYSTPDQDRPI